MPVTGELPTLRIHEEVVGVDLQRLRYFSVVAEELHFSRAAARLHLDQSALSASIRRLERDLGVPLFDRTTRRVELTVEGEALLPEVRRLLGTAERFRTAVRRARDGGQRPVLRVGSCFGPFAAARRSSRRSGRGTRRSRCRCSRRTSRIRGGWNAPISTSSRAGLRPR